MSWTFREPGLHEVGEREVDDGDGDSSPTKSDSRGCRPPRIPFYLAINGRVSSYTRILTLSAWQDQVTPYLAAGGGNSSRAFQDPGLYLSRMK